MNPWVVFILGMLAGAGGVVLTIVIGAMREGGEIGRAVPRIADPRDIPPCG